MASYMNESDLFQLLLRPLATDMVANGVPYSDALSILHWVDPANPKYVSHLDQWQYLLCGGAITSIEPFPQGLIDLGVVRPCGAHSWALARDVAPSFVGFLHKIMRLLIKFRGHPRKQTDWDDVERRLSHPCHQLDRQLVGEMQRVLDCTRAPESWERLVGKFGPGVTADRLTPLGKWGRYGVFPAKVPITTFITSVDDYISLPPIRTAKYGFVKMGEVPKTLKSNRLVGAELGNFMFAQLAVGNALDSELHRLFGKHYCTHDQQRHKQLLKKPGFTSIDLSDASDYVSRRLVFQILPQWRDYLFSVRASFALLPSGRKIPLRTFAPMGDGTCFRVLSAVTCTICRLLCRHDWSVVGDDMIVHVDDYWSVIDALEGAGLKVNYSKSCPHGYYRESCGCEMLGDFDITSIYLRSDPKQMGGAAIEYLAFSLREAGLFATLRTIFERSEMAPRVAVNRGLQQLVTEVRVERPLTPQLRLFGTNGLFRWFCTRAEEATVYRGSVRTKTVQARRPASNYPFLTLVACNHATLDTFWNNIPLWDRPVETILGW